MGIFVKRPLCLFCFCFMGAALFASVLEERYKLILFVFLFVCAVLLFVLCRRVPKRKYGFIEGFIALVFALVAVLQSFLAIDLPINSLERLVKSDAAVEFLVVSEESSSRFYTKYYGKLASLDGNKVNKSAYLVLDYEVDYSAGERLLLVGDVSLVESSSSSLASKKELEITSTIDKDLILCDAYTGFDVSIICGKLSEYVRRVLTHRLNISSAALSFGFLTGNTSMIGSEVIRDFRRAGLSHLLAVSGLHLSVILGGIEVILKKLSVSKGKRCVIISFLSLAFLALAGFSLSACRSVLMLLCAYLCYALSRERDTLTSLSVAGALILFISPSSVFSVSFWLSFLATLGIVLYGEVLSVMRLDRKLKRAKAPKTLRSIVVKIAGALLVTLSANVFICIVFFIVFGEMSVVFPISNLIVTPLGEAYLILTLLVFLLGGLPFIGEALSFVTELLCGLIIKLVSFLSRLDFSVVSLKYPFAGIIICFATALIAVLFIVKLRKRLWLVLPPIAAAVLFGVCLLAYRIFDNSARVIYTNVNDNDNLVISEHGEAVMIDVSSGSYSSFYFACQNAHENAITEIEAVLLTHYHARHVTALDRLLGKEMIRSVYLPLPENTDELEIMNELVLCAREHGVLIKTYKREEAVSVGEFSLYLFEKDEREGSEKSIISFSVQTDEGLLTYADSSWHLGDAASKVSHFASVSDVLVLGSHGPFPIVTGDTDTVEYPSAVLGANVAIFAASPDMPVEDSKLIVGVERYGALVAEFDFKDR